MEGGATLSACQRYRYALWRRWEPMGPCVVFIGLNPSTADAENNDPTIRRCLGFARDWGYGAIVMLNLYAWRSTDPRALWDGSVADPVGPDCDERLRAVSWERGRTIVAAWGAFPRASERARDVRRRVLRHADVHVLGLTKGGHPRHPLYARGGLVPQLWNDG